MIAMYRLLNIVVTACLCGLVFSQCQNHWIYHRHSCFYFSSYTTDWYQASGKCREHNSVLALIQSKEVSDWIDNKLKGHDGIFYVGASDEFVEGAWEWAFSGETVTFSNWAPGQGQGTNSADDCLVIYNKNPNVSGTWYDVKCSHRHNFICQQRCIDNQIHSAMLFLGFTKFLSIAVILTAYVEGACQPGWIHFKTSCYYFSTNSLNWQQASTDCKGRSAKLVSVDTSQENGFIAEEIARVGGSFWLDGTDHDTEGRWIWASSKELFDFTAWLPHEPSNYQNSENCLMTQKGYNGQWNDYGCLHAIQFICEHASNDPPVG